MDEVETTKILAIIKAAYPNSFRDIRKADAEAMITLWSDMFADTPFQHVGIAVKALIATCKFPPTISEIKEYISKLTRPQRMNGNEAWALIKKAYRINPDVTYTERGKDYTRYFQKLPREIQSVVGSPRQFNIWGQIDELELEQYEKPRFVKSFEARQAAAEEFERLPASVQEQSLKLKSVPLDQVLKIADGKLREKEAQKG